MSEEVTTRRASKNVFTWGGKILLPLLSNIQKWHWLRHQLQPWHRLRLGTVLGFGLGTGTSFGLGISFGLGFSLGNSFGNGIGNGFGTEWEKPDTKRCNVHFALPKYAVLSLILSSTWTEIFGTGLNTGTGFGLGTGRQTKTARMPTLTFCILFPEYK